MKMRTKTIDTKALAGFSAQRTVALTGDPKPIQQPRGDRRRNLSIQRGHDSKPAYSLSVVVFKEIKNMGYMGDQDVASHATQKP